MRRFVLGLVAALALPMIAQADVIVSVDLDTTEPGIQKTRLFEVGETFDVDVVISITGADSSVAGYTFGLRYDAVQLDFVSRVDAPPAPFEVFDTSMPTNESAGVDDPMLGPGVYGETTMINGFATDEFGPVPGPTSGDHIVCTITFTAIGPTVSLTETDFHVGLHDEVIDSFLSNDPLADPFVPTFDVANVVSDAARGDANGDGTVNTLDIDPFVLALLDPAGFMAQFPNVDANVILDFNGDGILNTLDIDGFVARLLGGR